MASASDADLREVEFRRRWYEAHARRARADIDRGHFEEWLPGSGERLADGPCIELYRNVPADTPVEQLVTDLCVPLQRTAAGRRGRAEKVMLDRFPGLPGESD